MHALQSGYDDATLTDFFFYFGLNPKVKDLICKNGHLAKLSDMQKMAIIYYLL
jgi:hypothetical protein